MKENDYLFVYGTLRKGFQNETARYVHTTQEYMGKGFFTGKLFKVDFYPGAVFQPQAQSKVHGDLFRIIHKKETLFSILNEYEGIGPHFSPPHEFVKQKVPVHYSGKIINAHTYLFNLEFFRYRLIPSGKFQVDMQ